jgi:hypothetical protein
MTNKNRNLFLVTASVQYILGLNSILNALEYYKHPNIDVAIVHPELMVPYVNYVKNKFSFNIVPVRVEDWSDKTMLDDHGGVDENANCIWCKYRYMESIKDDYDAICFVDADMLLLNNIMPYFKIVANTDLILCPQNTRSGKWIEDYKYFEKKNDLAVGCPVFNFIVFYNPKYNTDVVNYVWVNRNRANPSEEMHIFNKALYELDKLDNVLQLPGSIWLAETYLHHADTIYKNFGDFAILTPAPAGDRVNSMHSRWWNKNVSAHEIEVTDEKLYPDSAKHIRHNASVGERAIEFFNKQGKVTIDEIRQLSIHYGSQLDNFEKVSY